MRPETRVLQTRARAALDTCRVVHAAGDRTCCFDLAVRPGDDGDQFLLTGVVETDRLLGEARASVRAATGETVATRDVTVLDGTETVETVAERAITVRARPDSDAEQVTQALYGSAVQAYDERREWTRVRVADGYRGWVETDSLADGRPILTDAVLSPPDVEGRDAALQPGVECKVVERRDDESVVEFRTGERRTVPSESLVHRETPPNPDAVAAAARSFVGTPYEWGGKTAAGVDCSGLSWLAYRSHGVTLPRDTDQQEQVGRDVERDTLQRGDLLFFPGHVAISLGGAEYVHASGDAGEVTTNSLDPDSDRYREDLDENFTTARRVIDR